MANKSSATNGTSSLTAAELKQWYDQNKIKIEKYTRAKDGAEILRDVTQSVIPDRVETINKEELRQWWH